MTTSEGPAAPAALTSAGRLCVQHALVCGLGMSTLERLEGEPRRAYIALRQDFNALVSAGLTEAPTEAIPLAVEILEIEVDVLADVVTPYDSKAIVSFFLEAAVAVHAYRRAEAESLKVTLEQVAGPDLSRTLRSEAEGKLSSPAP